MEGGKQAVCNEMEDGAFPNEIVEPLFLLGSVFGGCV